MVPKTYTKRVIVCAFFLLNAYIVLSQPGKNGAAVISSNTIVNNYSPITANVSPGATLITVLAQSYLLHLCPGDLIMIYQAQGANINTANNASYGFVTAYNSAGLYEFAYVQNVSGNNIYVTNPITNLYSTTGMAQVIKVPQYTSCTINSGASIIAKNWGDTMVGSTRYRFGGLTVIHANAIVNNGIISSAGAGFRGGQLDIINTSAYSPGATDYVTATNSNGGEKGESIAGYQTEYDLINGRYGRGAPANGGGGGGGWNSGGGGGANGNNGNTWTGQGVMVVNASNPLSAWALDPAYVNNGNSLTTSSGGGRGGYSVAFNNSNPSVSPPGNFNWGADNRREVGGMGGRPLSAIAINRIYFGGGGGAGDENNSNGGPGGTGGGIVYLIATGNISGIGIISADGNNGFNTTGNGWDAPGGAGGGGAIILRSPAIANSQSIKANGGKGGDQFVSTAECEGPGGGGGGGFIGLGLNVSGLSYTGGSGGSSNAAIMTGFPFNGATFGASGQTVIVSDPFISYVSSTTATASCNSPVCQGGNLNFNATFINGASYNWTGPNGFSSNVQNPSITNVTQSAGGIYSVSISQGSGCTYITINNITVSVVPPQALAVNSASNCPGLSTTLTASGASSYTWMPGNVVSNSIVVSPTITSTYTAIGQGTNGCISNGISTISVGNTGMVFISGSTVICIGTTATLNASGATNYTWMPGNIISSSIVTSPQNSDQSYTVYSSVGICTAQATQIISVTPVPTINVIANTSSVCTGGSAILTASGTSSYTWNPGSFVGNSFTVFPTADRTYTVIGGLGSCTSQAVKEVSVVATIQMSLSTVNASICLGENAIITIIGASNYNFIPSNVQSSLNSFTFHPYQTTTYIVNGSSGACADTRTITIFVSSVFADFNASDQNGASTELIDFFNTSSNNDSNNWYFNNGQTSQHVNPSVLFDEPGNYLACLVVRSKYGCADTLCKLINVGCSENAIYVPNAFTPDDDGLNEIFKVTAPPNCIKKFKLTVFDRWGEKLFSTEDAQNGWDGRFKGEVVQDDVYAYILEYSMTNEKSFTKTGHVMVLKD